MADTQYERGKMPTGPSHSDGCVLSNGQLVEIKGMTNEFKASSLSRDLVSGESIIHIPGANIVNGVLAVPDKARISVEQKDPGMIAMSLNAASEAKKVLVLRADSPSGSTTSTISQISDAVFGTSGDPANLKSQYAACSHDKLKFEPVSATFNGNNIAAGVGEVSLSINVNGVNNSVVRQAMLDAADAKYGSLGAKVSNGEIDYVMLCIPPGTSGGWIAYAYINYWLSVYNNQWCNFLSAQMHELGHNLNLAHSGESATYDDQSGMMGYSYSSSDTPIMCFNAAKNWQLNWYPTGQYSVAPLSTGPGPKSFIGHLLGLSDYGSLNTATTDKIIVQITGYSDDYYVSFNRKSGINSGTLEGPNQVLVHSRATKQGYATSVLKAKLNEGGVYIIRGNGDTTITVNRIDLNSNPSFADIEIKGPNTDAPVTPPTNAPVIPPTIAPVNPPTIAPIISPTIAPVTPPTIAPINPPTIAPTTPPTLAPFNPPTLAPFTPPTVAPVNPPTIAPVKPPTNAPVCPSGYSGLVATSDCKGFYHCQSGSLISTTPTMCQTGLLFNEKLQVCDWPYNVVCKSNPNTPIPTVPPTKLPTMRTMLPTVRPTLAPITPTLPPVPSTFSPTKSPVQGATCPPQYTGLIPATDCTEFYDCLDGALVSGVPINCPGLLYKTDKICLCNFAFVL